ncbi:low molecular weight protein-tyrosine-phosphatase [Sphingomonas sp. AX6]|uniref:low molecular weight protein-tyrosine-phosphatase n=1 Tax=Sphingomonas sp. AX6 TaxID=2653171 RepID=UPI0012EF1998|nr:low molecular weight protein-tyrosine-phosphatase [Sphingomonas sp. AX6]VXC81890.1 Low molecular weight protein-tyrosine-phosphatase [Sphingomonas sp. AX6]
MADRSILFVCLGNICRSPLAEAAFRQEAEARDMSIEVASAGTGDWHVGLGADPRTVACAQRNGIDLNGHRAQQVKPEHFHRFDHIVALDRQNLRDLKALAPADTKASVSLLLDHVPGRAGESVADPYHGDARDFDLAWRDVSAGAVALVAELARADSSTD